MRRIGDYAQADFAAMRLAEELQALSVMYINDAFFAEEELNLDNLTLTNFLKAMESAREGGPVAETEFNRMLANIVRQAVGTVMAPPQEGGQ